MFGLDNLFAQTSAQKFYISRDRIAEILRVSPDALDAFEKAYSKAALQTEPESIFEVNSRQAAAKNERLGDDSPEELKALTERIVKELIWQTLTYTYDGKTGKIEKSLSNAPEKNAPVTNQDLLRIPASLRPQLSGELMKRDLDITASAALLFYYDKMQNGKTPKERRDAYNRFRQGLDILDLDALAYRIIGQNRNSIGHWFPELVRAYRDSGFFRIPATTIAKVPLTLLQLTRLDYHISELFMLKLNDAVEGRINLPDNEFMEVKWSPRSRTNVDMETLKIRFPDAYNQCVSVNPESSRVFSIKRKKVRTRKK